MNWIVSSNKVVHHLECIFCPKLRRQPLEKLEDAKKLGYLPCRICITKSGQWSNVVADIFHTINEKTHNQMVNPVVEASNEGITIHSLEPIILIAKNGKVIPIDDSAAPIKDEQGNITGAVLVFRDITERKQAQEKLQKQTEQLQLLAELERLNQLKDEFLSTVSHELRTSLSNMKMAIQMLKCSPNAERSERYLEILQAECAREIELINDFLDLQRLEGQDCTKREFCTLRVKLKIPNHLPSRCFSVSRESNKILTKSHGSG